LPSRVVVALGEPGVPVISTAWEIGAANIAATANITRRSLFILALMNSAFVGWLVVNFISMVKSLAASCERPTVHN
jgi:hypothetical protein